jgi:protein phosphatase
VVSEETLAETLRNPDPKTTADRMIELALRGGGPDNVTCIVADVVDIDFGEDAPIVGGAAGDGTDQEETPPNSAAARAAVTTLPRVAPRRVEPRAATPVRQRSKARTGIWVLAVLVLLVGAAALARLWVMQQYYVGVQGDQLVIYQGVRGSVLGIPLQRIREGSCPPDAGGACPELKLSDLQETARSAVRDGIISGDGLRGARATIRRLRSSEMLPPCPPAQPQPRPQSAAGAPPGQPAPAGQPSPETTTPLPSPQFEPGKTCRLVN